MKRWVTYELLDGKPGVCDRVLRSLPSWFGLEEAIQSYVRDVEKLLVLVAAVERDSPIGFLALKRHSEFAAEIYVMGVMPDFHRQGAGRALVEAAEERCSADGVEFLQVKTLSSSNPSAEYAATAFYQAMGFRPLEEIKDLWGEANPCLIMIKSRARTIPHC